MKKNELKKLRAKKLEELKKAVKERSLEISRISAKIASGQEKNLKKAKNLRKELAQTLTIIKEMEIVRKLGSKDDSPERMKGVERRQS